MAGALHHMRVGLAMSWQIRLGGVGAPAGAGEVLDLAALRSLAEIMRQGHVPLRARGAVVGDVREPCLIGRELFALAEVSDEAFAAQLGEWERRGCLSTVAGLSIVGRRVPMAETECERSSVYTAVRSVDVIDLPRGAACFLWNSEPAAGAELPGLTAPGRRAWRPRPARGADPLGNLKRRFARGTAS
ncbi:MAG: hypothetical protein Q7W02_02305 [Candidatus Rokubacteria bacterium]|nr:hypothetical protein [Candidatus Rokubacteria bacterium]